MLFTRFTTFLSVTLLATLASAADASANNNVAVYWGQNAGGDQQRLSEYCQSNSADIVILSFLNDFPNLGLNFANACGTTFANSTLLHCPQIGQDIKYCQSQGKIVLLSLGGAYGNYGFSSDSEATSFASVLWNKFGAGTADSQRPFDDAVVDGFDFDLEHQQQTGFVALANTLSSIYKGYAKKYYLSASPQCPYPDQSVGDVLSQSYLDFAFIQFYNNAFSLDKTFNWDSWKSYATDVSPNKNIKLYLGVPGTPAIAGYVSPSVIKDELALIQGDSNFGGVSIWDASFATKNIQSDGTTFLQSIIRIVKSFVAPTSSSSAAASSTSAPASSAPTVSASDHEEDASTAVVTNLATTVITVTSCSDHKCTAVPVTTGVVVVTEVDTTYTTFCPLSTEAPGTVTETDVSTTVITVTSCSDNKCTEVPVTTGLTVVTLVDTIYTTYCPLASATASVVVPVTSATAVVVPVTSATVTVAPVTSAPVQPTVVVSTYAPVVSSTSAANVTVPAVVTFGENAAIANNAKYGFALVACGLAMLV